MNDQAALNVRNVKVRSRAVPLEESCHEPAGGRRDWREDCWLVVRVRRDIRTWRYAVEGMRRPMRVTDCNDIVSGIKKELCCDASCSTSEPQTVVTARMGRSNQTLALL
jgi:hypothetical protein